MKIAIKRFWIIRPFVLKVTVAVRVAKVCTSDQNNEEYDY